MPVSYWNLPLTIALGKGSARATIAAIVTALRLRTASFTLSVRPLNSAPFRCASAVRNGGFGGSTLRHLDKREATRLASVTTGSIFTRSTVP